MISIVTIKRSSADGVTDLDYFIPLMKALNCNPSLYETTYSQDIINDLIASIIEYEKTPELFIISEEDVEKIPELKRILTVCKAWDLYFCIY